MRDEPLPGPDPLASGRRRGPVPNVRLGVVVPALDEADRLPALLGDLAQLRLDCAVVVVDGGSRDATAAAAREGGAWVVRSRRGRARQLNAGAAFLGSRWLLMLHADSRLDARALRAVERHVAEDGPSASCFGLAIDHPGFFYRVVEAGQRVRERWAGLAYGDQGLLVRRDVFSQAGGYPDEPLMEDVILNRRLAAAGRLERLPARIRTSARRYEEEGRVRAVLRNATLIGRFLAGAEPADLAARYRPRRAPVAAEDGGGRGGGEARRGAAALLVFAKAPRPGAVKTRLARDWGAEAAADAYRRLGRQVVRQLAGAQARATICFDPPGAEAEVRAWLGDDGPADFVPQGGGDLGARMARTAEAAFARGAPGVVVVGTDAPAVDAGTVRRALDALRTADVVLGPSADGGYYLIALGSPRPALFRDMPWSTELVFRETMSRCAALGLRVTCLPVESDIDAASDVTPELAARLALPPADSSSAPPAMPAAVAGPEPG